MVCMMKGGAKKWYRHGSSGPLAGDRNNQWLIFGQSGGAGPESGVQGQEQISCASIGLLISMTGKTQKEEMMENACGGGGWTGKELLGKGEEGCWARLFKIR
jgi:hypothetical protein